MFNYKTLNTIFASLGLFYQGICMTIALTFCALLIGTILGFCFGILNCNKVKIKIISALINAYVLLVRGTPLYVQVLIFYFALPEITGVNLSPFTAGMIALGCNSAGYVTEIVRCGINSIPEGQWDLSLPTSLFSKDFIGFSYII